MKRKKWNITIVDNPNIATISENDEFYTTDTEAFLVFELKDKNFNPTSATITLHNRTDGSVVNEDVDVIDGTIAYEMREEVIEHAGTWQAQLVYEQDKGGVPEKYTSKVVGFDVAGHLLDTKEPALVVIENWDNFVLTAEGTMERWKALEYIRQENENQRVAAETARQEAYDDLIDTGVMQENINQKLAASEAEYAPRLTELEQNDADLTTQLAQKANQSTVDVLQSEKMNRGELISVDQLDKNTKKLDQTFLTEELIGQITGNAPINTIPADNSLTTAKYVDGSVTASKLSPRFFAKGVFESGDLNNFGETGSYYVTGYGTLNKPDDIHTGVLTVFSTNTGWTTQIFHDIQPTNNFYIRNLRFWSGVASMIGEWQLIGIDSYLTTANKEWVV